VGGAWVASAKDVKMDNGAIVFQVPDAFTPLSEEEVRRKFPSANAPRSVMGNEARTVSVAFELKDALMPREKAVESELPNARDEFVRTFDRVIPGIRWIKQEIVEHGGRKWIHLELTSNAVDQDVHNIVRITFHEGKLLLFNFNSTKAEFPKYEQELRRCIDSVRVTTPKPVAG
jgi:hypothetical protein